MPRAASGGPADRAAVLELIEMWDTDTAARERLSGELHNAGVVPLDPPGGPFNEDYHRVVGSAPTFVPELDGQIAHVRRIGWAYPSGAVFRRADVVVYAIRRAR